MAHSFPTRRSSGLPQLGEFLLDQPQLVTELGLRVIGSPTSVLSGRWVEPFYPSCFAGHTEAVDGGAGRNREQTRIVSRTRGSDWSA